MTNVDPIPSDRLVVMAYMDSGNVIQFECDEFELTRFPETYIDTGGEEKNHPKAWEIAGYTWKADTPVSRRLADLDVNKIEGIVTVRSENTEGRESGTRTRNADRARNSGETSEEGRTAGDRVQGDQGPRE